MLVPGYPCQLEDWWLRYVQEQFGCDSLSDKEAQIAGALQSLSDSFTTQRTDLPFDYSSDPGLLGAYGCYFFPENFVRIQFVITELMKRGWSPPHNLTLLDLGAGTGAAALSIAMMLSPLTTSIQALAVDQAQLPLRLSERLVSELRSLWPNLQWLSIKADLFNEIPKTKRRWDVIVVNFALNEIAIVANQTDYESALLKLVKKCSKELSDDGILLIIEPAMERTSQALERLRDMIQTKLPLHIWAPCLHELPCPLLKTNKFWCHEVRAWTPPDSLRFLNRRLQRQINVLKFCFLVLGRKAPGKFKPVRELFRMISPVTHLKGKWVWEGCAADGKANEYRVLKRNMTADLRRKIETWERGDILRFSDQDE